MFDFSILWRLFIIYLLSLSVGIWHRHHVKKRRRRHLLFLFKNKEKRKPLVLYTCEITQEISSIGPTLFTTVL